MTAKVHPWLLLTTYILGCLLAVASVPALLWLRLLPQST